MVADESSVDSTRSRPHRLRWYRKSERCNLFRNPLRSRASAVPDTVRVGVDVKKAQSPRGAASSVSETSQVQRSVDAVDAVAASTGQRAAAVTAAQTLTPVSAAQAAPVQKQAVPAVISEPPTPQTTVPDVVSGVLTAVGVSPVSGNEPGAPVESPASVALFAGWRRLSEQGLTDETSIARSQPVLTSQTEDESGLAFASLAVMAVSAPAVPTVGSPNLVTGTVSGSLNGYTVPGQPASGKVDVVGDTYIYTPTAAARLRAAVTTQPDYDSFAVALSGQPATSVTVAVLPGVLSNSAMPGAAVLNNPTGLAVHGNYAYVANQGTNSNTVSVINTTTGAVDYTITVGSQPSAVAVSPAITGSTTGLAYVTNRASGTVSVINTTNKTVVGSAIGVGSLPQDVAVAHTPTITRVYVANSGGNNVSVIDTRDSNRVSSINLGSGNSPQAVAVSPDGTRAYVAYRTAAGAGRVSVINTANNKVVATVNVGSSPQDVAVSPLDNRVYVANNGSSSVSVINPAANNSVSTINVGSFPTSLAVSPDKSVVLVARSNDSVAMIDTKTNTVIGAQHLLDTTVGDDGGHIVAFSPDGRGFVTDAVDRTVRVIGMTRGNTAPVGGAATVVAPNPVSGLVSGSVQATDADGDALIYSVTAQPSAGGTVTLDSVAGTFSYVPSVAARDLAATTTNQDFTTFTVTATDRQAATAIPVTVEIAPQGTNHAPVAGSPYYGANPATGTVTGVLRFTDPDGDPLTFQLGNGPWDGTITLDSSTGAFTYNPSYDARVQATLYPEYNTDWMTYTVSDGQITVAGEAFLQIVAMQLPPTAWTPPSVNSADPATGRLTGSINAFDPNYDPIAYAVTRAPTSGTATVDANGTYTYTPHAAARTGGGVDSFAVTVSDGQGASTFEVTVPIRPPELASSQTQIPLTGTGPTIAVYDSRAYVFNKYHWTVSAIDLDTNTVIRTSAPLASGSTLSYPGNVAVTPDGARVYVANWVEGKIHVLDSNTLAPIGQPIAVSGGGDDMLFSPDGSRLYLAHDGAPQTMSIIDTASRTVIGSVSISSDTTDMVISADGSTIYVTDGYNNKVQVIDTGTRAVVGSITLGAPTYSSTPGGIALSPDGRWAYVTNTIDGTVSVIDINTRTVVGVPIVVGVPRYLADTLYWPTGIAASPNGSRIYVAKGDDVVVIDAATRTVLGSVRVPAWGSDGSNRASQGIAVDSNGDILVYGGSGIVSVSLGAANPGQTSLILVSEDAAGAATESAGSARMA